MEVLIRTIEIRSPSIFSSIIQVKHGVYIIHAEPIHMEYFQPEAGIGDQEILYHWTVIIVKHGPPHWVNCHIRILHFIKRRSVKFLQAACVPWKLGR